MDCEKCPIKEECEKRKLCYSEGKRILDCPLLEAAYVGIRNRKELRDFVKKLSPEERKKFFERVLKA